MYDVTIIKWATRLLNREGGTQGIHSQTLSLPSNTHVHYIHIYHALHVQYNVQLIHTHTHTHTSVVAWDADSDHFPLCVSVWIIQRGPPPSVQAPALPWVGQDGVLPLTGWPWVSTTLNCAHCGQCHEQRARHTGQWTCDTHALYMYVHVHTHNIEECTLCFVLN